jgi:putative membrane protein
MTTSSEPAAVALAADERRLHPLSWLFLMLAQLRQFALPLIAVLVFGGRGDSIGWELIGAIAALLIALGAVLQYYTYRFRIDAGELIVRSGVFQRTVRQIPLRRIQNVALRRTPLHRLAGVAEVRLESAAGSNRAEAEMRVLSLADAAALEALVRASRSDAGEAADVPPPPLLSLPTAELVRLGLASNRGMVVVAAFIGVLSQYAREGMGRYIHLAAEATTGAVREFFPGPTQWLVGVLVLLLAAAVLLRLLSVALALARFHGFRLVEDGQRLSVEAGLLTRLRGHASRQKIQRWMLQQNLWLRLMDRFGMRIETAAVHGPGTDGQALTELVPIAPRATMDGLLQRWLPALGWPALDWQPLHPQAWRRFLLPPAMLTLLACLLLWLRAGPWAALLLLLLPLWWLRAWRLARWSAWLVDERFVAWRSGWLDRHWQLVEIDRIQLLRVEQSPFDRRRGMANLLIDTAGADPRQPPLRLRYLPEETVSALAARLARRIESASASGGGIGAG